MCIPYFYRVNPKKEIIAILLQSRRYGLANLVAAAPSVRVDLERYRHGLEDYVLDLFESSEQSRKKAVQEVKGLDPHDIEKRLKRFGLDQQAVRFTKAWKTLDDVDLTKAMAEIARWAVDKEESSDEWYRLFKDLRTIQDAVDSATDKESWDPKAEVKRILSETAKAQGKILRDVQGAIKRIEQWNGTPVVIRPMVSSDGYGKPNYLDTTTSGHVYLGPEAGFTYFDSKQLDDILHAGDRDFFTDPKLEQDYFNLVKELQNPGSSSKPGKLLTLYTARPLKDRKQLEQAAHKKALPNNIFLTDSLNEAEGYAIEYAPRDIWKVKILERYVTMTQERGGMAAGNYQTMGPKGEAPVKDMVLLNPADETSADFFSIVPKVPPKPPDRTTRFLSR